VQPVVSTYSVQSEGAIYLAAFSVWALGIGVRARSRNWLWPLAGILAGLANLSRSEGLILIVLLLVAAAGGKRRVLCVGTLAAGYIAVMMPLFVANLRHFGTLMPPASGSFRFITTNEDLYSRHVDHSLSALLGESLWQFVDLRITTFRAQLQGVFGSLYAVDAVIFAVLLGAGLRGGQRAHPRCAETVKL